MTRYLGEEGSRSKLRAGIALACVSRVALITLRLPDSPHPLPQPWDMMKNSDRCVRARLRGKGNLLTLVQARVALYRKAYL